LLAGDALLNRAFECMLRPDAVAAIPADRRLRAAYVLADAAGINGMVGGQVIDLQSENREIPLKHLELLQEGKTAALIRAACVMGCVLAGADDETCMAADQFGREVGLCFQIVDDILDVTSDEATLGKPVNSDAENTKNTYVSLLGVENSKALAAERTARAIKALSRFGEAGKGLESLAEALLHRKV
jgi:geranylgeranyl diphosphate synthase type II